MVVLEMPFAERRLPDQSHEVYLAITVTFMIITAYLDWSKVLFACAYSGKGHFLELIHIQQENIGFILFYLERFSFETLAALLLMSLSYFLGGKQMEAGRLLHNAPEEPASAMELLEPPL